MKARLELPRERRQTDHVAFRMASLSVDHLAVCAPCALALSLERGIALTFARPGPLGSRDRSRSVHTGVPGRSAPPTAGPVFRPGTSSACMCVFGLAVPTAPWEMASQRVIAVLSATSVAVHGGPALARRGWVCPRTPSPAACPERGDIDGFAPSPDPLLRRLSERRSRRGQGQLAHELSASGAPAVCVRGLRLRFREGTRGGAVLRPAAQPAAPWPQTANPRSSPPGPPRRVIGDSTAGSGWSALS